MCSNDNGFSLIEVLIASVILFGALSLGAMAYRGSIASAERVSANVAIADSLPSIMESVKTGLLAGRKEGQGTFGRSVKFSWSSKEITSAKNILSQETETLSGAEYGRFRVALNDVTLTVRCEESGRMAQAEFTYQELSWSK